MTNEESKNPGETSGYNFCPECGHKGLYHIKKNYYRCRYCGTYLITPADKNGNEKRYEFITPRE